MSIARTLVTTSLSLALLAGSTAALALPASAAPSPAAVSAAAQGSTVNVDRAASAYDKAFLVSSGSSRYYRAKLSTSDKDYFWQQALDIQGAEDVYVRTGRAEQKVLVGQLLDTFLQQNRGSGGLYDWSWNEYNDDLLWAGLAFARGYQITGNTVYLNQAKYAFNRVYDRGWDDTLGGGVWWSVKKEEKNALSNSPAVILGMLIWESTGEQPYFDKASRIYDWVWAKLVDRSTGAVHEKMDRSGQVSAGDNVYTDGAFVSAAQALYRNTGRPSVYADAQRTVDWVVRSKNTDGIMTSGQREGTWQSEFARGMGEFVRENNLWGQYYGFMKTNADAAWKARRTDLNITWNRWDATTPRDDTRANESIGAVVMAAVTPDTNPAAGGGGDTFVSQLNGKCIDVPKKNFSDGVKLATWTCTGASNQRFTPDAGRLRSQNGLCLDAAGGATTNGTAVQLASLLEQPRPAVRPVPAPATWSTSTPTSASTSPAPTPPTRSP